jgi:hypothetical protein
MSSTAPATISARDLDKKLLTAGLTAADPARGWTPNELARLLRVSPDRVREWVKAGIIGAVNVSAHDCGRPRYVILPHHLAEFEKRRAAAPPPKPQRRRRKAAAVDYFP